MGGTGSEFSDETDASEDHESDGDDRVAETFGSEGVG